MTTARERAERLAFDWARGDSYAAGAIELALLAERRRAIEEAAKIASEKREACLALREAATRRDPVAFAWHGAQAQAFHEAAHAISSLASPREET